MKENIASLRARTKKHRVWLAGRKKGIEKARSHGFGMENELGVH